MDNKGRDNKGLFVAGNNIAPTKWTEEVVFNKLLAIHQFLDTDQAKPTDERQIRNIIDVYAMFGLYEKWMDRMRERYNHNEELVEMIDVLFSRTEKAVWDRTADGQINPYLGLFSLKAYHNRVEKQYVQTDNKNENKNSYEGEIQLNINYPNQSSNE